MPTFETVAGPFAFTEGPVWDGQRVIFTAIPTSRIMAFDPSTEETSVHLEDGSLLVACGWPKSGPGPRIAVFAPDRDLTAEYPTPANPSNLCFGGPEGRDLYVTGASGELWRTSNLLNPDLSSPWSK